MDEVDTIELSVMLIASSSLVCTVDGHGSVGKALPSSSLFPCPELAWSLLSDGRRCIMLSSAIVSGLSRLSSGLSIIGLNPASIEGFRRVADEEILLDLDELGLFLVLLLARPLLLECGSVILQKVCCEPI